MRCQARVAFALLAAAALAVAAASDAPPGADAGLVVLETPEPEPELDAGKLRTMSHRDLRRILKQRGLRCDGCDSKQDVIDVIL
jgi:hypothetical protein